MIERQVVSTPSLPRCETIGVKSTQVPARTMELNTWLRTRWSAGKLVLSMNDNAAVEKELLHYLDALKMAARGTGFLQR